MQVSKVFNLRAYIYYKLLNSLFLGLSVGVIFFIYSPLEPLVYTLGGVILALGLLGVAKVYEKIINYKSFFIISFGIEILMLGMLFVFLILGVSYSVALLIYIGYQVTFMFGGYLVRAETYFLSRKKLLSIVDVAKQIGYLIGMLVASGFYKSLEYFDYNKSEQIVQIHYLLVALQVLVIVFLLKGFKRL